MCLLSSNLAHHVPAGMRQMTACMFAQCLGRGFYASTLPPYAVSARFNAYGYCNCVKTQAHACQHWSAVHILTVGDWSQLSVSAQP